MSMFDDLVEKNRGMVLCVFGRRCDEMTKEELIALLSWQFQENEKLRRENCEASIAHVKDLARMVRERNGWR